MVAHDEVHCASRGRAMALAALSNIAGGAKIIENGVDSRAAPTPISSGSGGTGRSNSCLRRTRCRPALTASVPANAIRQCRQDHQSRDGRDFRVQNQALGLRLLPAGGRPCSNPGMCDLHSIDIGQQAIRDIAKAMRDATGYFLASRAFSAARTAVVTGRLLAAAFSAASAAFCSACKVVDA